MFRSLLRFSFSKFTPAKVTCWNCKSNEFVNKYICGQCKYLKDPTLDLQNANYFELFDMSVGIVLDQKQLENKYRELQLKFHPDRFVTMPQINISYSQEYSAYINEAYSTLKNIHERAEYILALKGYQIKECSVLSDLEFMEEILDLQSQVQMNENIPQIDKENQDHIDDLTNKIIKFLQTEQFQKAYVLILYMRYRLRLRDQIQLKL